MNIYDLLNRIITDERHFNLASLFKDTDRDLLDSKDIPIFDIIKNISSVVTRISDKGITFTPMFTFSDGSRSFAIEDLSDTDYLLIETIELDKIPLLLRALIADVLWTQKKNHKASIIAAQSYWELFQISYRKEEYIHALEVLKRTVCISVQTKLKVLYDEIYQWFCAFLTTEVAAIYSVFSLRTMELFIDKTGTDLSMYIPALDAIISKSRKIDQILIVEQSYNLKTKCLHKLKKEEEATKNNLALAQFYFDCAEMIYHSDALGALRSEHLYEKAILTYRNNGATVEADSVHRTLIDVQKQIPKSMQVFYTTLDTTKVLENIKANLEGLSFQETIIRLAQYVSFESVETIRKNAINESVGDPLASLFGTSQLIDSNGQTILKIAPLDQEDPEKDPILLELHMFHYSLRIQRFSGDILVRNILEIIRNKYSIDDSMLDFLTNNNCIIPEGRERIFRLGLTMFLRGEYYEAMHLLAPQMENLFRHIAEEVGGIITTLSDDGLSQQKVLKSVFTMSELLDAYDNDIVFAFRGLLNEKAGANIRNRIAHGIIEEKECSSGEFLLFGALIIKLLSFTSYSCLELYCSEKLQNHQPLVSSDFQIIR